MENRLKERLTGAAILVALIVLIVPEIFHERRGVQSSASPAPAVSAAPTRSYTIELAPTAAPAPAAPPTASNAASGTAPAAVPAAAPAAPPAAAASAGGTATAPGAEVQRTRAAEHAGHSAHGARSGMWAVQLGLFSKESNAQHLARSAQSHGFAVGITRFGSRGLYRVAVVGLADRAAAEQLSRRLHDAGLPGAVLGPR